MNIRLNIDTQNYTAKPGGGEIGKIRNRLCNEKSIKNVTPEQFMIEVSCGRTFTPAVMTGTTGDTWQCQQVICADIDNDSAEQLTPEKALKIMAAYSIKPYFMYNSFSNTDEKRRFRIVLILDEPITDAGEQAAAASRFIGIFNAAIPKCADVKAGDRARFFYGGKADCIFYASKDTTTRAALLALPASEQPKEKQQPASDAQPVSVNPARDPLEQERTEPASLDELKRRFEYDKNNFDLGAYIERTTNSRLHKSGNEIYYNPCPLCGHNDDCQVTDNIYHCHSASEKGGTGGSIIDYLMHKKGEELPLDKAIEKFKFEIMGYSREEWTQAERQAYIEEKREREAEEKRRKAEEAEAARNRCTGAGMIDNFLEVVQTRKYEPVPTGITDIDKAIGGGFIRQQLVLLGAAPGAGKTALTQWIFENMAASGAASCLYLNLEMSREQMIARSLSRVTARNGKKIRTTEILQGYKWTDEQRQAIAAAGEEYKNTIAPRMMYNPDGMTANLDTIMQYLEAEAARAEVCPFIVIDYLQIVSGAPHEDAGAVIKRAVAALKGYAVKYNTVVFVIIAHNRVANAGGSSTMESGRDTSALEYSADLQLALDFTKCLPRGGNKKKDDLLPEEKNYKTLRVLKGRFGGESAEADLHFDGETMTYTQIARDEWNEITSGGRSRIGKRY